VSAECERAGVLSVLPLLDAVPLDAVPTELRETVSPASESEAPVKTFNTTPATKFLSGIFEQLELKKVQSRIQSS